MIYEKGSRVGAYIAELPNRQQAICQQADGEPERDEHEGGQVVARHLSRPEPLPFASVGFVISGTARAAL